MISYICAWCQEETKEAMDVENPEMIFSHGICNACFRKLILKESESLAEYLDSILDPVFVVDQEGRIISASSSGRAMLNKDLEEIKGVLGGDAFSCQNAKLPGGCGHTIHCKDCAIRRCIEKTLKTGTPQYQVPATLNEEKADQSRKIHYLISTEKKGDAVLLRIDNVTPEEIVDTE